MLACLTFSEVIWSCMRKLWHLTHKLYWGFVPILCWYQWSYFLSQGCGFHLDVFALFLLITSSVSPLFSLKCARNWVWLIRRDLLKKFLPDLLFFLSTDDKGITGRSSLISDRLPYIWRLYFSYVKVGYI